MRRAVLIVALLAGCSSLPIVADDAAVDGPTDTPCAVTLCGSQCGDLARDPAHCGACDIACGTGVDCMSGQCERRVVSLSSRWEHTCAVAHDGSVWCWGSNEHGQIGAGSDETVRTSPTRVPGVTAATVVAGWGNTFAIDAAGRVWSWGQNLNRTLADDERADIREPVEVHFPARVTALAPTVDGLCALVADGGVWCRGSLGAAPMRSDVAWADHTVAVTSGGGFVCALREDGSVGCGGKRDEGQQGDVRPQLDYHMASTLSALGPVHIDGLPAAVEIAGVGSGVSARTLDNAVWFWGHISAEVHDPALWMPTRVEGLSHVQRIFPMPFGCFARLADGSLFAWGYNVLGGLGDGTTTLRATPVPCVALDAIAPQIDLIAGGQRHACALLRDGTVRCWGSNVAGTLGTGTLGGRSLYPVAPRW